MINFQPSLLNKFINLKIFKNETSMKVAKLIIGNSNRQTGQVFIFALIILSLVVVTTVVLLNSSVTFLQNTGLTVEQVEATNLAEAGLDKAVATLNAKAGSYTGEEGTAFGSGMFSVTIS